MKWVVPCVLPAAGYLTGNLHAGSNIDLVALLYQPAQFETKLTDIPGGSAPPGGAPQREAPSVLDALHSLNQQCHVFKKSAEQLGKELTISCLPPIVLQSRLQWSLMWFFGLGPTSTCSTPCLLVGHSHSVLALHATNPIAATLLPNDVKFLTE